MTFTERRSAILRNIEKLPEPISALTALKALPLFWSEDHHVDANLAEWLRPSSFSSRFANNPRS
jgi:hypothetical protein